MATGANRLRQAAGSTRPSSATYKACRTDSAIHGNVPT